VDECPNPRCGEYDEDDDPRRRWRRWHRPR
jgi:hypothetical protein